MADNGSAMYLSGAPDDRWDNNDLNNLSQVPASAFEVVQMNPDLHVGDRSSGLGSHDHEFYRKLLHRERGCASHR